MILITDVHYQEQNATVAGVIADSWGSKSATRIVKEYLSGVADYCPGQFYKRELPCILRLIESIKQIPDYIVIDGYVHFGNLNRPGLGEHLYRELGGIVPIIGIAKNYFSGVSDEYRLYRGQSTKPLFITSIGIELFESKHIVAEMHGNFRLPTLVKLVDSVCRES